MSSNTSDPPKKCNTGFQSWEKIKTLPRLVDEYQHCKIWYQRIKDNHWIISMFLTSIEFLTYHFATLLMTLYCADLVSPMACWIVGKVRIVDEFICHQLEFVEKHLSNIETEWIYKPRGLIERVYWSVCLAVRLLFVIPRVWYNILIASVDVVINEGSDDLELLKGILSPPQLRRSRRVRAKKGKKASSPGKKRKHEEIDNSLPRYFYVHEYSQDSDPDFVPNSDDNDTEITSASEHSHDDDEEHSGDEGLEIVDEDVDVEEIESQLEEGEFAPQASKSSSVMNGAVAENPDEVVAA